MGVVGSRQDPEAWRMDACRWAECARTYYTSPPANSHVAAVFVRHAKKAAAAGAKSTAPDALKIQLDTAEDA